MRSVAFVVLFGPGFIHANLLRAADSVQLAASHPRNGQSDVAVSASISLRFSEALDLDTLRHIQLYNAGEEVAVAYASDLTNASITISPKDFLEPNTSYELRGSSETEGKSGAPLKPFKLKFRTGARSFEPDQRLVFDMETFDDTRSMTTVLFGPDRRLYAADAFGHVVRWDLDKRGTPIHRTVLLDDPRESRQYIDLEWDPQASAQRPIVWASYAERLASRDERFYFTGTIARIELGATPKERVVVTGLPHGREKQGGFDTLPHQPNGLVFKGGKLFQSVGSTSSSGGPPNWGVPEQPLSACILEIDYEEIEHTLDVHPQSRFDWRAPESPVKIFATGVRNALEIVAHSGGRLYTAVNINDRGGPGDGVPDDPDIPGDQNQLIKDTTPDHESLYILERGRHYGFPNPARGQFVLNGGNPTAGQDPFEIEGYPVGTRPESGFAPDLMFPLWQYGGTSPDGMIEYLPHFDHPLRHALICCFYSAGDIAVMQLGTSGLPAAVEKLRSSKGKLVFAGPLDITQDPATGILYVADFGKQGKFGADGSMKLLRPAIVPADPSSERRD